MIFSRRVTQTLSSLHRSRCSFWLPEPKVSLRVSVCWRWYAWPHGTRSWTPGSTSCWGRLFWGKSLCCFTAAGAQGAITYTAGSAVCSAAQWRPANLTGAALVDYLHQTLPSNPLPEPWSEKCDLTAHEKKQGRCVSTSPFRIDYHELSVLQCYTV